MDYLRRLRGMALVIAALLCGCATTTTATKPHLQDRWEPANRAVYRFNDALDRVAVKPVAKGYKKITPNWFRKGVGNFFTNLEQPVVIVNELLQAKPKNALTGTGRLVVNTVFGIGGLFDPATAGGIPQTNEDFGQTLGRWGVPSGPYLMLPFLGPSTMRDAPSKVVDYFLGPLHYVDMKTEEEIGIKVVEVIDSRARLLTFDESIQGAYDPYAFIRNAWLQRREYAVQDGNVPEEPLEDDADAPDADSKK